MNIKDCINKGFLKKIEPDTELSNKELKEAKYDIESSRKALNDEDYKWSIIKSYYSMFHAAKYLLYKLGYKERKHIAVIIVLEELEKEGKLESRYINDFKAAITAREEADYHYSYSKDTAEYDLNIAEEFINEMQKVKN